MKCTCNDKTHLLGRCPVCIGKTTTVSDSPEFTGYVLSRSSHAQLCGYLSCHEYDIATGTNDFMDLFEIFEELLKRKPTDT